MLKQTNFAISKPLCLLFNKSLEENTFPEFWKLAHVFPCIKKMTLLWHQTIIQCLCCVVLVKLWKKIIFKHMYNFLHCNHLFYKYQAGLLCTKWLKCFTILWKVWTRESQVVLFSVTYLKRLIEFGIKVLCLNLKLMEYQAAF